MLFPRLMTDQPVTTWAIFFQQKWSKCLAYKWASHMYVKLETKVEVTFEESINFPQ